MRVEVFSTTPTGQEPYFTVSYEDGTMSFDGVPEKLIATWEKVGIPYRGKRVMPEDGEKFLQAVAGDFNGSMSRSDDVVEEEE